jgi:hypothetical protein
MNKPLAVVVATILGSGFIAVFVYGLSAGGATAFVLVKGSVLAVGLLAVWLTVERAGRRKTDGEDDAEISGGSE